jgi:hypothetical protein
MRKTCWRRELDRRSRCLASEVRTPISLGSPRDPDPLTERYFFSLSYRRKLGNRSSRWIFQKPIMISSHFSVLRFTCSCRGGRKESFADCSSF